MEFSISGKVHQELMVSTLLFTVFVNAAERVLQQPTTLFCVDDVMLGCEDKDELQRQARIWCDRLEWFGPKGGAPSVHRERYFRVPAITWRKRVANHFP